MVERLGHCLDGGLGEIEFAVKMQRTRGKTGLFVLPRVRCIFTANSISLSPSWRQRGHRYAIRAGRNLPDKEFRYLRTVIVTAAVYRGFSLELRVTPNPSL